MADGSVTIDVTLSQEQLEKALGKLKTKIPKELDSLKSFSDKTMKAMITGITAVSTAVAGIGVAAVKSYADLEQNIGGVETLFKDSADSVIANANRAYKTAGMSANEYMSTVTSFSASLLQGLSGDTKKACDYADMAVVDMSDNANKMGTSMELIQNAYQGFAKQNYTMLDNLKLGYGGTQAEMARLINDSGVLGDKMTVTAKTVNQVSFDKILQAIHIVQERMGITGTTAKEAAETISGSISSTKAAWDNFLNGSGDFSEVIESAKTAFTNIYNAAKEQLPRIGSEIIAALPDEFVALAKNFIGAITGVVVALTVYKGVLLAIKAIEFISGIWNIISAFITLLPAIRSVKDAMLLLNMAFSVNPIALIVAAIAGLVVAFVYLWNTSEGFRNFWINLWENIKKVFETVWNAIVNFFTVTIPEVWNNFINFCSEFTNSIIRFFSELPRKDMGVSC